MLNVSEWKIHRDLVIAQVAYGDNDGKTIFRCFDLNKDTRKMCNTDYKKYVIKFRYVCVCHIVPD